ncbi:MAG: sn-glycerol-3-phosphate ABC transporter ATP-binding protein UgpC, partial [Dermatophilaceae bacterium]|nr:sn-glycerol-3-phosphate ABC transporter ATP-binding protein UgpC [Dermatophilaceae bacterium]
MATVTFDNATRQYPGNPVPSVDKLNIDIADGEFLVLVGPSGCGKSTSLRMLAGLEEVNGGRILIGDRDVTNLSPKDRDVAMVFQNYALYPHMSVADNMGFALKIAGVDKSEIRKRVEEAAKILDLTQYLERKPKALSGGQRQRVAMGRAIVRSPQVFLMDEPLSNLDAKLRVQTRTQIASLQRRLGVTTVYVTHDQVEAMTMGDRVAVLKDGLLQQCDTPRRMYDHPANVFVAGFIGSPAMNLVSAPVVDGGVDYGGHTVPVERSLLGDAGKEVTIGVRPEDLEQAPDGHGIEVTVDVVEELGADAYIYGTTKAHQVDVEGEEETAKPFIARVDGRR